ncbi:DUF4173 domain-containing protein [Sphaerisporangium sp. NBC_01403]|uniref:DUF4153 domain-containing protein n=1 Tax=Sphaerisporangium sp. NBC_01403 TaxID=2903599 RepID=UPI003255E3D4
MRPLDFLGRIKAKLGLVILLAVATAFAINEYGRSLGVVPSVRMGLAGFLSLGTVQLLGRGMTGPLREMAAAAQTIAKGRYGMRVTATSRDEVGELARAFNAMAADLAEVDRQRRELVANVSHELRTPITGLQAVLENIVDGVSPPDLATLSTALAQTERLGRLVAQLLDLSRLDSGARPIEPEPVELGTLCGQAVREASLARDDVSLSSAVSPRLGVQADPALLGQVLANLLDNAVRHSPPGGLVRLEARPEGAGVRLSVTDEGPGIPEPERPRVFERFSRLDTARAADAGGAGLGLAIVKEIVELHGGSIRVADSPVGCRMVVGLPGRTTVMSDAPEPLREGSQPAKATATPSASGPDRVREAAASGGEDRLPEEERLPSGAGPVPVEAELGHSGKDPLPDGGERVRTESEPAPTGAQPARTTGEPVGVDGEPAEASGDPVGLGGEPVGVGKEPAGLGKEPVGVGAEPVELGKDPAGLGGEPVGVGKEPAGLGKEPVGAAGMSVRSEDDAGVASRTDPRGGGPIRWEAGAEPDTVVSNVRVAASSAPAPAPSQAPAAPVAPGVPSGLGAGVAGGLLGLVCGFVVGLCAAFFMGFFFGGLYGLATMLLFTVGGAVLGARLGAATAHGRPVPQPRYAPTPASGPVSASPPGYGPVPASPPGYGPVPASPPGYGPVSASPPGYGPVSASSPGTGSPAGGQPVAEYVPPPLFPRPDLPETPRRLLFLAAAVGLLAAIALPDSRPGLGIVLVAVAAGAAVLPAARHRITPWTATFGLLAYALVAVALFRDAGWLVAPMLLAGFGVAALAVSGVGRGWLGVIRGGLSVVLAVLPLPWFLATPLKAINRRRVGPVLAALGLTAVLIVVFGLLFASADAVFSSFVTHLFTAPAWASSLPFRIFVFVVFAALVGAATLVALRPPVEPTAPNLRGRVSGTLWITPLVALNLLFASFVGVQITTLFGGNRKVVETAGLTYAEYARSGFFELVTVSVFVLGLVAVAAGVLAPRGRERWLLAGLLGLLCGFTLVILASALHRLGLYTDAYGLSRLRASVGATIWWLGAVFALVLVAGGIRLSGRRIGWLPRATVLLTGLSLVVFAAWNPDLRVAETQLHKRGVERLDVDYLSDLGAEAVPVVAGLPEPARSCLLSKMAVVDGLGESESWNGWNLAREHARDLLRAYPMREPTLLNCQDIGSPGT